MCFVSFDIYTTTLECPDHLAMSTGTSVWEITYTARCVVLLPHHIQCSVGEVVPHGDDRSTGPRGLGSGSGSGQLAVRDMCCICGEGVKTMFSCTQMFCCCMIAVEKIQQIIQPANHGAMPTTPN